MLVFIPSAVAGGPRWGGTKLERVERARRDREVGWSQPGGASGGSSGAEDVLAPKGPVPLAAQAVSRRGRKEAPWVRGGADAPLSLPYNMSRGDMAGREAQEA